MWAVRAVASAAVQVFTSGTDWAAIAAAISGGLVGLAGIFAAWRQSGRTISAEDKRAKVAEKRRIYARYLTSITEGVAAAGNFEIYGREADPGIRQALEARE
jgi:hypothetical protein